MMDDVESIWDHFLSLLIPDTVTEIVSNRFSYQAAHNGGRWEQSTRPFPSEQVYVESFFTKFVPRVQWTRPIRVHDTSSPSGWRYERGGFDGWIEVNQMRCRVHVLLPGTADSLSITITRPALGVNLETIASYGTMSAEMLILLRLGIRKRWPLFFTGRTGSGKTTLMSALSQEIDPGERIILIEDLREIVLRQPNTVSLLSDNLHPGMDPGDLVLPNYLIGQVNRMRGERIIYGEVREGLAFRGLLNAATSGMKGILTTFHADSAESAPTKITAWVMQGSGSESERSINKEIADLAPLIIQMRDYQGRRVIEEIREVYPSVNEQGVPHSSPLYKYVAHGVNAGMFQRQSPMSTQRREELTPDEQAMFKSSLMSPEQQFMPPYQCAVRTRG